MNYLFIVLWNSLVVLCEKIELGEDGLIRKRAKLVKTIYFICEFL